MGGLGRIGLFKGYSLLSGNCVAPRGWGLGGNTSYNGLNGEAPPARGIFFRLHKVYERVGISLVLDERVGKSVISVARRPKGTNRYISCL